MRQNPIFCAATIKLPKERGLCVALGHNPLRSAGESVDLVGRPGSSSPSSAPSTPTAWVFLFFMTHGPCCKEKLCLLFRLCYTQNSLNTTSLLATKCVCVGGSRFRTPNNSGTPAGCPPVQFSSNIIGVSDFTGYGISPMRLPFPQHTLQMPFEIHVVTCGF